jgi:hypothetical protein
MGCRPSRDASPSCRRSRKFDSIEDSVHVMLEHDKKLCARKGQAVTGYVPRAAHPLLVPQAANHQKRAAEISAVEEGEEELDEMRTVDLSQNESDEERARRERTTVRGQKESLEALCWHAAHHATTVDPLDVKSLLHRQQEHRIPSR